MLKPKANEVRKPTKTISGITPVAVMLPPRKCEHGNCLYCPSLKVPQSYTPKSPVVMRASMVNYDSYKQIVGRLKAFEVMNHPTEKVEIIIMGGTFLEYPKNFQYDFIKGIYDGLNGMVSKNLKEAQNANEKTKHRCVALCIETRPDVCCKFIDRLREFGCTRVELGVQIIDDEIYEKVKRGHKVEDVVKATKCLKDAGFKIGYHIMPGLPGSNLKKDLKLFEKIFSDERFKPDQLKIYPCQVMPGSELEKLYWKGKYKPYSKNEIEKVIVKMLKAVPRYCRVMRVMREIPPDYLVAGTIKIDLRRDVEKELRKKNFRIKEIRYREIGFALRDGKKVNEDLKLKVTKYKASKGEEYFLEIVNSDDILFGLLRLRIFDISLKISHPPSRGKNLLRGDFERRKAIIREIHVYGKSLKLGEKGKVSQHRGLGKELMKKAEEIVRKNKIKKVSVISGIGVREYYKKLGYKLEGTYMVKFL